jgi:hypothetical protein
MKYKVGDKVRIVSKWVPGCRENSFGSMNKWLGKVMTIRKIDGMAYKMVEDETEGNGEGWFWYEPAIEVLVSRVSFTKADLKNGDIVLQRSGVVQIYIESLNVFVVKDGGWNDVDKFNDDLTHQYGDRADIVAVRRPLEKSDCVFGAFDRNYGELVYDRERDTVVEMTMEEICAALGKTIKIVKEK